MRSELKRASSEVISVLNILPKELTNKIPQKLYNYLIQISDKDYIPMIDLDTSIYNQKISDKAKDILIIIYREYWCTEEERKLIDKNISENEINNRGKNNFSYIAENYIEKNNIKMFKDKKNPSS